MRRPIVRVIWSGCSPCQRVRPSREEPSNRPRRPKVSRFSSAGAKEVLLRRRSARNRRIEGGYGWYRKRIMNDLHSEQPAHQGFTGPPVQRTIRPLFGHQPSFLYNVQAETEEHSTLDSRILPFPYRPSQPPWSPIKRASVFDTISLLAFLLLLYSPPS